MRQSTHLRSFACLAFLPFFICSSLALSLQPRAHAERHNRFHSSHCLEAETSGTNAASSSRPSEAGTSISLSLPSHSASSVHLASPAASPDGSGSAGSIVSSGSTDTSGSSNSSSGVSSDISSSSTTSTNSSGAADTLPQSNNTSSDHSAALVSLSISNSTNTNATGQFWAGAAIGTVARMEDIPGRVFYDYDGKTVKDPIITLGDAGVNAIRVEGGRDQCLGPTNWINNDTTLADELLFKLDFGCADTQVKIVQRAIAQGMRVVLTINQGFNIPPELENATYEEMIADITRETKRQLTPYLDAKIVPDIILLENEGSDGILFNETATGHARGIKDSSTPKEKLDRELCGQLPTGNMASYPQVAGYYKAEILAANAAITAAGFSTATVRYGLHSHAQYVDWKEGVVHGPDGPSETLLKDSDGNPCPGANPIPQDLLSKNVSTMLNIAGFSAYPDPIRPTDIDSPTAQRAMLTRPITSTSKIQSYAERYGRFTSGPFAGQYKLQALGVEWATRFTSEEVKQEQAVTEMMWTELKKFEAMLGVLYYEPWYCYSDWEGGDATLARRVTDVKGETGEAPTEALKTWGAAARSPWMDAKAR